MTLPTQLPTPAPSDQLRYDTTVPRALVHRMSVAEVFVTDSAATGTDVPITPATDTGGGHLSFEVAAQLPRGHVVGEHSAAYDFLLLVEVLRQSGVLVAHRHLDVPLASAFIFMELGFSVRSLPALRIGSRPAHAVIQITVLPDRNRAGRVLGFSFSGALLVDGHTALEATGRLTFVSHRAFGVLRAKGRGQAPGGESALVLSPRLVPAEARSVGRRDPRNVVITEPTVDPSGNSMARLVVNTGHPHLFDHELDHIPGNLQLEAARQLAVATVARLHGLSPAALLVTDVAATFGAFAELDRTTTATAQVGGVRHAGDLGVIAVPVTVLLTQGSATVSEVTMEVAPWS
ncbi:secondary metabolite corepressor [Streptomyces sp. JH002]|uniref:AfsA-related hotdog domain-containing protein n=1 Tax=Streptomyces TaxID=1883 RepID=UPI0036B890F4